MWQKMNVSNNQSTGTEQGFTMMEVLVAILIATAFVLVSAQSLVIAAIFRLKAQRAAEATLLIQEDLENIKHQASIYTLPTTSFSSFTSVSTTQDSITVADATNFNVGNKILIEGNGATYSISSKNGNTLTLNSKLRYSYISGTTYNVTNISRCDGVATSATTGLADAIRDAVYGSDQTTASSSIGPTTETSVDNPARQYSLTKILSPKSNAQPSVLGVSYTVTPLNNVEVLATLNTEVIPDAAFQCPPQ